MKYKKSEVLELMETGWGGLEIKEWSYGRERDVVLLEKSR